MVGLGIVTEHTDASWPGSQESRKEKQQVLGSCRLREARGEV
jgi:hypothetical protein